MDLINETAPNINYNTQIKFSKYTKSKLESLDKIKNRDILSSSQSLNFHKVFSNKKFLKNDILSSYNSFIKETDVKPVFLTNFIRKTNNKINKLKYDSVCKSMSQIVTLNTLPNTDNTELIKYETENIIKNSKEFKMIPPIKKEKITENYNKAKKKTINLEQKNICM